MVAESANGPSQIKCQLPIIGNTTSETITTTLDSPKLIIIVRSPPFLRLERVLRYCFNRVSTIAGTIKQKYKM